MSINGENKKGKGGENNLSPPPLSHDFGEVEPAAVMVQTEGMVCAKTGDDVKADAFARRKLRHEGTGSGNDADSLLVVHRRQSLLFRGTTAGFDFHKGNRAMILRHNVYLCAIHGDVARQDFIALADKIETCRLFALFAQKIVFCHEFWIMRWLKMSPHSLSKRPRHRYFRVSCTKMPLRKSKERRFGIAISAFMQSAMFQTTLS